MSIPIRWRQRTAASNPEPCAWLVWVEATTALGGGRWVEVWLHDS